MMMSLKQSVWVLWMVKFLPNLKRRIVKEYNTNMFNRLPNIGNVCYTFLFTKKHLTTNLSITLNSIDIVGTVKCHSVLDSDTFNVGYIFETPVNTKVSPLLLSVSVNPRPDNFFEVMLPPKNGFLAYASDNSSLLLIPAEEVTTQYVIKDYM